MSKVPTLRIRVPYGMTAFTSVELNGQPFIHATRISFDTGDSESNAPGMVKVRMEFYADIEVEAQGGAIELVPQLRDAAR